MAKVNESSDERRQRRRREKEFKRNYARARHQSESSKGQHSIWRRRLPYLLFGLAIAVALGHFAAHANVFGLRATGWEDLLVGYPTALVLAMIGGILLPASRT